MARRDEGIDVSYNGKVVNRDVPSDEDRRKRAAKKSGAKKRLRESQADAETTLVKKKSVEREGYKVRDAERTKAEEKKKKKKSAAAIADSKRVTKPITEKKKKKRKTTGELIADGKLEKAKKRLNKFSSKAIAVIQQIQGNDGEFVEASEYLMPTVITSESEFLDEYGRIYGNLQAMMRKMEKNMMDPKKDYISSKDVYALSTLYSQMRETMADMRSIKDMNAQAASLSVEVIDPVMRACGEAILAFYFRAGQIVRQYVSDPRAIEAIDAALKLSAAEQGQKIQVEFELSKSRIVDVLNGTK